jgi:hypothetical protein
VAQNDIVREVEELLQRLLSLTTDGEPSWPSPPADLPADKRDPLVLARYQSELHDVEARRRDPITAAVEMLKSERAREDETLKVERARQDETVKVERAREDETLKVEMARQDASAAAEVLCGWQFRALTSTSPRAP